MFKTTAFLKIFCSIITVVLFLFGLGIVLSTVLYVFGFKALEFTEATIVPLRTDPFGYSPVVVLIRYLNNFIFFWILWSIRQFLSHLIADKIFIPANVTLANRVSLLFLIVSLTTDGLLQWFRFSFLNPTYLIAALVVWTLAMILEKANVIAEENAFTV
ncbi:hypothetical protein [Streptococcus fryi]